jgi:hypothetical protein
MSNVFVAEFRGSFIECPNADDAIALMIAEIALGANGAHDRTAPELDCLADALARYGQREDAERLHRISVRRAAAMLSSSGTA